MCDIAILQKYIDIFAGTFGFWLLGYAISGNTNELALGEEQDYVFWFFRVRYNHAAISSNVYLIFIINFSSHLQPTLLPSLVAHLLVKKYK